MMRYLYIPVMALTLMIVFACSGKHENHFVKLQTIQSINYELSLLPTASLVQQELGETTASASVRDSLEQYYSQSRHFLLKIYPDKEVWDSKANDFLASYSGTFEKFRENLDYLIYNADENTMVVTGQDTVKPLLFHCERGYELTPEQRLLFVFPREKTADEGLTFLFKDDLFNNGLVKFHYDTQVLENE